MLGVASAALFASGAAPAQSTAPEPASSLAPLVLDDVAAFYNTYKPQPIWTRNGINEGAAARLVSILQRATFDGFPEGPQLATQVQAAVAQARSGDPAAAAGAERILSGAWVRYGQSLR